MEITREKVRGDLTSNQVLLTKQRTQTGLTKIWSTVTAMAKMISVMFTAYWTAEIDKTMLP